MRKKPKKQRKNSPPRTAKNSPPRTANGSIQPATGGIRAGKIVGCVFMGLLMSFMCFLIVGGVYTKQVTYPDQEVILEETTGAYALKNFVGKVHSQESVGGDDYLVQEITYANGNEHILSFIEKVVNTVDYTPYEVEAHNKYGNTMIDKETKSVVTISSNNSLLEELSIYLTVKVPFIFIYVL